MPLTSNGNFILKEDALGMAKAHESMAEAFDRLRKGLVDLDLIAKAEKLAKDERAQAEELRRIAAGEYNEVAE